MGLIAMLTSTQTWFGYGSILWWTYLAITTAVLLSCLGLWIYAVREYPRSHAESDCHNVVSMGEQLVGEDRAHPEPLHELPTANHGGSESQELRTA
jgi:hypothetical protein